jgi:hypothetical protein
MSAHLLGVALEVPATSVVDGVAPELDEDVDDERAGDDGEDERYHGDSSRNVGGPHTDHEAERVAAVSLPGTCCSTRTCEPSSKVPT